MRTILIHLALAAVCLGQDPQPAPPPTTTQSLPLEGLRAGQRERLLASLANLTELPARPIDQLLRLSIVDGLIAPDCLIHSTNGVHRIELTDVPGIAVINAGVHDQTAARWIDFQHTEFTTPETICTMLQVFMRDEYLQIAWDITGVRDNANVQCIQSRALADEPAQAIRLYVQRFDAVSDELIEKVQCSGGSIQQLLNEHRGPVLRYLVRPLFDRRLHRGVLVTPTEIAWTALGESVPAPPEVAAEVEALVRQLDSETFAQRRAAAESLRKLGPTGAMALKKVDRDRLSEEQRQAVDGVLASYADVAAPEARAMGHDPLFLIGVLYGDQKVLWPIATERLMAWRALPTADPGADPVRVHELADRWLTLLLAEQAPPSTQPATQPAD